MQLKRRLIASWDEIGFPLQSFPEVKFGEVSLSFRAECDIGPNSPSVQFEARVTQVVSCRVTSHATARQLISTTLDGEK